LAVYARKLVRAYSKKVFDVIEAEPDRPPGGGRHRASAGPAERNAMLPIGCWACLRCILGSFFGNAVVPRMFHTGRAHSSSFLGALIYEQVNLR
jgi:hypothetical protein